MSTEMKAQVPQLLAAFTWYKQAAFRWKGESKILYIDPWGLDGDLPEADLILITHAHQDHFQPDEIKKVQGRKTTIVAPADVAKELTGTVKSVKPGERLDAAGIKLETVPAYNIVEGRTQNHPKQNNWVGYLLQLGGRTYYHAGDTDNLPELQRLKTTVAFVPIGGTYTMDVNEAAALVQAMKPEVAVPMHFGFFPGVGRAGDGERFKTAAAPIAVTVLRPTNKFANP
jgi:L-ascorbate metabolism protein UlaG (beta-lactamase superfamily)